MIRNWIKGTGNYKISESVDKGKYLECTTAGTAALQSKTAYGEWEFDVYKDADKNSITIPFISDRANATLDGANGYNFRVNSNEQVVLDLNNDGSHTAKIVTAASYISNNTWYRLKITRTTAGVFTVLIKGGVYGNTETGWTLVDTTGGSGSNPVVDSTYTTSEYFVADLNAGDRLANIKIMDGVKQ